MMAHHAWLDSLSEDWVSQPGSDTSQAQLPSPESPPAAFIPDNSWGRASRIPRFNGANPSGIKRQQHHPLPRSPSVLSERNPNDINIRAAQLKPSRFSQENKAAYRGRHPSRSASASTASSVIHNSVLQIKSHSASPSKDRENEPEWKRRLIYGELDYGESKDLFSSAATGLENIFRPPQPSGAYTAAPVEIEGHTINETTLPSSPPPYSGSQQNFIAESDVIFEQDGHKSSIQHNMSLPKPVLFRSTADDNAGIASGDTARTEGEDLDESETKLDGEPESSAISFRRKQLLDESRKISGQSDTRNEDFSPIFIARHSSEGGRVSFSPMELPAHQLRNKLENLRRNQMILDPEPDMDSGQVANASNGAGEIENTEDFARNGGFLNLQRGERSINDSFRRRPLSPPINIDTSDMLPESSLQASTPKQFPTVRTERFASAGYNQNLASPPSPSLPRAPHPSPEKMIKPTSIKTSSPLKLFGPYDTFTNQTLLRRISQFEDQQSNHNSLSYAADETAGSLPQLNTESKPQNKVASPSNPVQKNATRAISNHQSIFDTVNRFGAGELDEYEFEGDISLASSSHTHSEEKENVAPPRSREGSVNTFKFDIHEDMPSEGESLVIGRTRGKVTRSWSSARHIRVSKSWDGLRSRMSTGLGGPDSLLPPMTQRDGSEGKRPRTSPSKDPTPKRRRTLHRSDIAYGIENWRAAIETVKSSHYTMQSVITKDHKQIRQAGMPELIDPNIQSAHHILRPRSPTPNQRASEVRDRQPLAELNFNPVHGSAKSLLSEPQAEDTGINASRKTSMKTQDFYDAAEEVMAMIRNKARPATGLASVEESEAESSHQPAPNGSIMSEDSFQESTREPFSRPPSRDGRPIARLPVRQEDPELVNRLKKYEEHGDLDDILSQSLRSMKSLQINDQLSRTDQVYDEDGVISDIPNVRISRNPDQPEASRVPTEFPSHKSQSSSGSTRRSAPTSSSRGSDSRRLIAPNVVAQLIGNQVGNMVFDNVNKMWQKVKAPRPTLNILPSEDSEDDPFASIPDLTVDTVKERKHLDLTTGKTQANPSGELEHDNSLSWTSSKSSNIADEFFKSKHSPKQDGGVNAEVAVEDDEEIEHEISLHEDRIQKASPSRPRNLTITFSSPIASIIQDLPQRNFDDDSYSEESNLGHSIGSIAADSIKGNRQVRVGRSVSAMASRSSSRSRSRGAQKNVSVEGHFFVPRPVSRIDERDEDAPPEGHAEEINQKQISIHEESAVIASEQEDMGNPELSVVMVTPNPARATAMLGTPIIGQYVGTLSLSPMSEFTVHQMDNSCALEVSYVMGDQYLMTGDGSKKSMSKAVRTLVEKITEVEPFEPDWETVPELDLSNKQLDTLHMLDEFCTTLVTLDASNNKIPHLDGVPQSVRNLRITHNALSELTAWRQLMNLQYVDVSNNQIKSLSAFKDLIHLRTLRADNNQITSLDGIKFHDSLQVLRARGNMITHVDFDGTKMQRLTELDLENNQIVAFENSEQLTGLSTLNLQHNCLTSFAPSDGHSSLSLRFLKLSNNELETLDLAALPSLRVLHADRNNIMAITGLSHCRRLDSLSLREQKGNQVLDTSFLDSAYEVRKLFLSGNRLSGFNPQVDFLNLQYLELANCGLQVLSPNLGQLMPNLRVLNINFNAIDDLWPLRYIPRLKKLLAAGNRLSDAQKISSALAEFPHLSRLDLRNNGATLGFYAPVHALVSAEVDGKEAEFDPFTLPDVDIERQEKFASRLDMDTGMRKRIYNLIILKDCKQLKMLDGLPIVKDISTLKDDVWTALMETDIVENKIEEERATKDASQQ